MPQNHRQTSPFYLFHLLIIWGLIALFIIQPMIAHEGAEIGARLFMNNLLPYLLPYIILTQWLLKSTASSQYSPLLHYGKAYVLGAFGGFPVGAVTLVEMTKRQELSMKESSLLLGICHAPGPMFLLGFVGLELFQDITLGWKLLIAIHLVNGFFFLLMLSHIKSTRQPTPSQVETSQQISSYPLLDALKESAHVLLLVATTVIFFSSLGIVLTATISNTFTVDVGVTETLLLSFFEMTAGMSSAYTHLQHLSLFPYIIAAILTANGLSIHMQIFAIAKTAHLSLKPYLLIRLSSIILVPLVFFIISH